MAHNDYDGLENGVLPWHCLGHAPIGHVDKQAKEQFGVLVQQGRPNGIKSPSLAEINSPVMFQGQTRCSDKAHGTRNQSNWAGNGPGMQAIFLGPKKKSCGTGVFIPRGQGTEAQFSTKPAFSPVLLPARVIEALNLNVHELGQHNKPAEPEQDKNMVKQMDEELEKKEDDVSFAPEILLPEEWTY